MKIEIRTPKHIPADEMNAIAAMVLAGNEVLSDGLKTRLARCRYLVTAKNADKIIGISAIKGPNAGYVKRLRTTSGFGKLPIHASEWGYAYVLPGSRRQGIYRKLMDVQNTKVAGPVFATVRANNAAALSFLSAAGWERIGGTWPGRQGDVCLVVMTSSFEISPLRRVRRFFSRLVG